MWDRLNLPMLLFKVGLLTLQAVHPRQLLTFLPGKEAILCWQLLTFLPGKEAVLPRPLLSFLPRKQAALPRLLLTFPLGKEGVIPIQVIQAIILGQAGRALGVLLGIGHPRLPRITALPPR